MTKRRPRRVGTGFRALCIAAPGPIACDLDHRATNFVVSAGDPIKSRSPRNNPAAGSASCEWPLRGRLAEVQVEDPRFPVLGDFVEKVEKPRVTKTRQIAIRWNIAAQHHLRLLAGLARCLIDKLAGPPADFLNAALIGLPENRASPKESFSTQSPEAVEKRVIRGERGAVVHRP